MFFPLMGWEQYLAIVALPVLGFCLGARWMHWRQHLRTLKEQALPAPIAAPSELTSAVFGTVESLQRQLEELAERQDFAERLLAQRSFQAAPDNGREQNTPH